ncbi:MAG TPA: RNA methyltransferase [Burkholderiales bacterium]|nr:RNA methyltransferase [Burkholderiales bacterium]
MTSSPALANVRVVLSHTSHPGNIGAAARAMKTMGLADLWLVNPKYFPDPQAEAMASGAADVLERARVCETLDKALEGTVLAAAASARGRELRPEALDPRRAAPRLAAEAAHAPVALVFGNEQAGLTAEEAGRCQLLVRIPVNPDYPSLNLAAAVQVLAYELRLAALGAPEPPAPEFPLATLDELERFYQHLEQTLIQSGFLDPDHPKRLVPRLRRLFSRARLEKEEVNILRGVLRSLSK